MDGRAQRPPLPQTRSHGGNTTSNDRRDHRDDGHQQLSKLSRAQFASWSGRESPRVTAEGRGSERADSKLVRLRVFNATSEVTMLPVTSRRGIASRDAGSFVSCFLHSAELELGWPDSPFILILIMFFFIVFDHVHFIFFSRFRRSFIRLSLRLVSKIFGQTVAQILAKVFRHILAQTHYSSTSSTRSLLRHWGITECQGKAT